MNGRFSLRGRLPHVIAIVAIFIAALAAREFFKEPDPLSGSERAFTGPIVGEIQFVEGQVLIRPPRGTRFDSAKPGPYRAESVLQTQAASAAVIEFRPGPTLRLLENSRLVTELDGTHEGALQVTILAGEVTVLKPDSGSLFTLIHNGVPVSTSEGETPVPRTVPLIRVGPGLDGTPNLSTDLEAKLEVEKESELATTPTTDLESINPAPLPAATPSDSRPKTLPLKNASKGETGLLHSTLTNDDIRTQVRSQGGSFQKCYVTMVNRMSESGRSAGALPKGETLVGFKILPTGKVEDQRVIRSPFHDPTFDRCIAEAISRLRFRQFQGASIPVGEFPILLE